MSRIVKYLEALMEVPKPVIEAFSRAKINRFGNSNSTIFKNPFINATHQTTADMVIRELKMDLGIPKFREMMMSDPSCFRSGVLVEEQFRYLETADGRKLSLIGDTMHETRKGYEGMRIYNAQTGEILQDTLKPKTYIAPQKSKITRYDSFPWNPKPVSQLGQKTYSLNDVRSTW